MGSPASAENASRPVQHFTSPPDMPVPERLNAFLVALVFVGSTGLLWLASAVQNVYLMIGVAVVFSYVLLTNYALLHEATHGNLQSNPRRNYALGVLAGTLFPIPFSMICLTHQGHHLHNRTDAEMFDLYYPDDNRVVKYIRWYGILCGFFWPLIPLGAVLFSIAPSRWREKIFAQPQTTGYMFSDVHRTAVWAVRAELLGIVIFFAALHLLLGLRWGPTLICYACFSLNWSTRQYVGHAFSKRDIIDGAWNLRHNRVMSWLLLHGELDKTHHRRPDVSWIYLPKLTPQDDEQPTYFRQYWRQWLGPRPNAEPAPRATREAEPARS
jgi:fatty acid desaturase